MTVRCTLLTLEWFGFGWCPARLSDTPKPHATLKTITTDGKTIMTDGDGAVKLVIDCTEQGLDV